MNRHRLPIPRTCQDSTDPATWQYFRKFYRSNPRSRLRPTPDLPGHSFGPVTILITDEDLEEQYLLLRLEQKSHA